MLFNLGHRIVCLSVLREDDIVWSCFVGRFSVEKVMLDSIYLSLVALRK